MNREIVIQDWAGNRLFEGAADDPKVFYVLRKNFAPNDDIFLCWKDRSIQENAWECVDF